MSTQSVSDSNILQKIIIAIFEANDMHDDLHKAFAMYIDAHKLNRQMENINFNITKKASNEKNDTHNSSATSYNFYRNICYIYR